MAARGTEPARGAARHARAARAATVALALGLALAAAPPACAERAAGASLFAADPPGTYEIPVVGDAPDFEVRDAATGKLLRLSDLRGRAVVLSLFYTRCADGNACPLATATLRGVQRSIRESALADRVMLLSVTFDERRDTLEVLDAQRKLAGAGPAWIFASPETQARRAALLAAYDQRIGFAPDGTITHPLRVFLIDDRGRVRQIYSQGFLRADVLWSDIQTVLGAPG